MLTALAAGASKTERDKAVGTARMRISWSVIHTHMNKAALVGSSCATAAYFKSLEKCHKSRVMVNAMVANTSI